MLHSIYLLLLITAEFTIISSYQDAINHTSISPFAPSDSTTVPKVGSDEMSLESSLNLISTTTNNHNHKLSPSAPTDATGSVSSPKFATSLRSTQIANPPTNSSGAVDDLLSSVFNPNVQSISGSQFSQSLSDVSPQMFTGAQSGSGPDQNLWSPLKLHYGHQLADQQAENKNNKQLDHLNQQQPHLASVDTTRSSGAGELLPTTIITIKNHHQQNPLITMMDATTATTNNSNNNNPFVYQQQQQLDSQSNGILAEQQANQQNIEQATAIRNYYQLSGQYNQHDAKTARNINPSSIVYGQHQQQGASALSNNNNVNQLQSAPVNGNKMMIMGSGGMQGSSQVTETVVAANGAPNHLFSSRPDLLQNVIDMNSGQQLQQHHHLHNQQQLQLQPLSPSNQHDLPDTFTSFQSTGGGGGDGSSPALETNNQQMVVTGVSPSTTNDYNGYNGALLESDQNGKDAFQKALTDYMNIVGSATNNFDNQQPTVSMPDSINALINTQQHQHPMISKPMLNSQQSTGTDTNHQQHNHQQQQMTHPLSNNNNGGVANSMDSSHQQQQVGTNLIGSMQGLSLGQHQQQVMDQIKSDHLPLNRPRPSTSQVGINGNQQPQSHIRYAQSASSQHHQTVVSPSTQQNGGYMQNQYNQAVTPFPPQSSPSPLQYDPYGGSSNMLADPSNQQNRKNGMDRNEKPRKKKRRPSDNSRTRGRTRGGGRQQKYNNNNNNPYQRNHHLNQQFYEHDSPMDLQTSATFPLYKYKYPYPPYRRPYDDYDDDEEEEETEINVRHYNSRLGQQGLARFGSMTTICVSIAFLILSNLSLAMSLIAHSASAFMRHLGLEPGGDRRKHPARRRRDLNGLIERPYSNYIDTDSYGEQIIKATIGETNEIVSLSSDGGDKKKTTSWFSINNNNNNW